MILDIIDKPLKEIGCDVERQLGEWRAIKHEWLWEHERVMSLSFDDETESENSEGGSRNHSEDSSSGSQDQDWQSDADKKDQSQHRFDDSACEQPNPGFSSE